MHSDPTRARQMPPGAEPRPKPAARWATTGSAHVAQRTHAKLVVIGSLSSPSWGRDERPTAFTLARERGSSRCACRQWDRSAHVFCRIDAEDRGVGRLRARRRFPAQQSAADVSADRRSCCVAERAHSRGDAPWSCASSANSIAVSPLETVELQETIAGWLLWRDGEPTCAEPSQGTAVALAITSNRRGHQGVLSLELSLEGSAIWDQIMLPCSTWSKSVFESFANTPVAISHG